jgi:glutaminase
MTRITRACDLTAVVRSNARLAPSILNACNVYISQCCVNLSFDEHLQINRHLGAKGRSDCRSLSVF